MMKHVLNSIRLLVAASVTMALLGCVQFKAPICTTSNLSDIPGVAGEYEFRIFDSEKQEITRQKIAFSRVAHGQYDLGGKVYDACIVAGKTLLQGKTNEGNYEVLWIRPDIGSGGTAMTTLAVDSRVLKEKGIPYELIKPSERVTLPMIREKVRAWWKGDDEQSQILLVDNSGLSAEEVVQLLEPLSFDMTVWRLK